MATVDLTWTDNSGNEGGFYVYRTTTSSPSFPDDYTKIGTNGVNDTTYTDSNAPDGTTVHYAVTAYNSSGESSATTTSIQTPKYLTRTVTVSGGGVTDTTRSATSKTRNIKTSGNSQIVTTRTTLKLRSSTVLGSGGVDTTRTTEKPRTTTVTGDGEVNATRNTTKPRTPVVSGSGDTDATRTTTKARTATTSGNGETSLSRTASKLREPALAGVGGHSAKQAFHPVFPDERALDVTWDFNADHMGFASEWLSEDSIIDTENRDGVGVTIGGSLSTTIEVLVEYDKNGDGTADVTSEWQDLSQAYHTLAFDDDALFGEDGWYRVVVRGLRAYDTVNQLDVGAVHANL